MESYKVVKTFVVYQVEGSEVRTRAQRLWAASLSLNLVQTRRTLLGSKQKVFDFCGDMCYWMISPFTTCPLIVNILLSTLFVDSPGASEPDGILYLHVALHLRHSTNNKFLPDQAMNLWDRMRFQFSLKRNALWLIRPTKHLKETVHFT
jgi:hypothetical protein